MLFSVEQAFVGRDEKRAPLKAPAWEANQGSIKSFFSSYFTKRKLIDDSFELSGSHLCLKTVHSALH